MKRILEICCDSLASALIAERAGADRIELCENLPEGGVTPSAGKIKLLKKHLQIPVVVLIRPRIGDFCYSDWEIEVMLEDIAEAKALGADGIVAGALHPNLHLQRAHTKRLMEASYPLPFIFHKAFDVCKDPIIALEQLIEMGVERILTSGQAATALEGNDFLKMLLKAAQDRIQIMAGGGVRPANIGRLKEIDGMLHFHSAAKKWIQSAVNEQERWYAVDEEMVKKMRQILDEDS